MHISDILRGKRPTFSFEFMAPRSKLEVEGLFRTMSDLARLRPHFVCVTCRPISRDMTLDLAVRMSQELGLVAMAHLICVGTSKREVIATLDRLQAGGVENVLALRGDLSPSEDERSLSKGLEHASDLAAIVAAYGGTDVGGACYPEKHPESESVEDDVANTLVKVRSGASFLITQLFFENEVYFDFVRRAAAGGISVPILPGIMPITHFKQLARVKQMGATVPPKLESMLTRYEHDPDAVRELGIAWASIQCMDLLKRGAPGIHFYTFNRSPATRAVHGALAAFMETPM